MRQACREAGSQQAWAEAHGFSTSFVSDVLHAKRPMPDTILAALGLARVTSFRSIKSVK